jgi:diguanylate cyclase (GGDEF)-like protein
MGSWLTSRRLLAGYAAVMALLVAAHYAFAGLRTQTAGLIGLCGGVAILIGVARNRPARLAPWLLLAAANLSSVAAELSLHVVTLLSDGTVPFPSFADAIFLAEYPLSLAGLLLFVRSRSTGRDWSGWIDGLCLAVGLGLLSWLFFLELDTADPVLSWLQRSVAFAFPLGDVLILLALSRLLAPGTVRGASIWLLTVGTLGGAASDVVYDLLSYTDRHAEALMIGLGWIVCYIAWGAAALHPSMTELTRRDGDEQPDPSPLAMAMLLLASLIPPVFLFVRSFIRHDGPDSVIAVACALLFVLMFTRLWDLAASGRRGLVRERTLRMASAALASAGSVAEVAAAVRDAAVALVPKVPADRAAILTVRDGDYLRQVNPSGTQSARPPDPVSIWLKLAEGRTPKFVSVAEIRAARFSVAVAGPAPDPSDEVGCQGALLCPLTLKDRPVGDPFIGLLEFFGNRDVLRSRATVLEILAGQAALAVERLELSAEVVRQRGEALFRTLVQDTTDVVLIIGDDRRVRYATPSAADLFGIVTVEGKLLTDLVAPSARADVDRVLDLTLLLGASTEPASTGPASTEPASTRPASTFPGYLLHIEMRDGRMAVLEIRWSDLRHDATVGGLVFTLRDVTEQHELQEELKHRAFHDTLTGLPNRALFTKETSAAMAAAQADGRTAGVLFVDLDDFKVVNDTMGHSVGDELLVAVAARLASAVRRTDIAARFGGDEFALLIGDAPDPDAVDAFAERIVAAFAEPFTLQGAEVLAAATVGVATSQDSVDVDELLRHADLALYAAKTAGKRRWRHYQPVLTSGMRRRRELQTSLEDAVKAEEFTLAYQPIVALTSGEIAGFEALIRWPSGRYGMTLPGEFIPLAEETGLIVPLGGWVLRQALSDLVRWRQGLAPGAAGGPETPEVSRPHVSVNVSARQFRDPGFVDSVRQALHASGLPPAALLLELTESLLLGDNDRIRAELTELKEIGVGLAIDDFGTGYSSLSYLLELPIDVLKIDKLFVTGIASSWRRHALVEGIVRLARTLEVEVIAEGIESETERELLAGMGCQFGQGYLLSVPVDAAAAAAMLHLGHGLVPELPRQRRRKVDDPRYLTDS